MAKKFKRTPAPGRWTAAPDRFEPGSYLVKDAIGAVLANGFATLEEAQAWIEERGRA